MLRRDQESVPYLAPLDGIRAVAVIAVILYHVWPASLRGGFSGVDVFFVLSGFLITSIVLHDLRKGTFSIREFYVRRIQRLLPNTIAMVLAVLLFWVFLLPPGSAIQPARHGLWTLVNLSNVYIWKDLGHYWGDDAEWAPLTHTWSLGVEEQFYLLFPCSLMLLARFQSSRVAVWMAAATLLSFLLCLYGTYTHPDATFYLLPTRFWELLLGAVLASLRTPVRGEWSRALPFGAGFLEAAGWVGLGMILIGFLVINEHSRFPGAISLVPTTGTILVLLSVAEGKSTVSRLLSTPFLVGTGKRSYSLYLWHWPLIILGKMQADLYGLPQLAGAAVGGFCGIVLGWAAYMGVEKPLRKRGPGRPRRLVTIAAGFAIAAICCGAIGARHLSVDPLHRFDTPAFYGELFDTGRPAKTDVMTMTSSVLYSDVYFPPIPVRPDDAWRKGGFIHLYGGGQPKIVVIGSSHALMYSKLIDEICRDSGISVAFLGMASGTPAFFETRKNPNFSSELEAREFDEARKKWIGQWHPDTLFVIDRWDWDFRFGRDLNGFDESLRSFLREVTPLANRVIFVAQVPVLKEGEYNLRGLVTWRMGTENALPRLEPDSYDVIRKEVVAKAEAAASDFPNLRVLRADRPFYNGDSSVRYAAGRTFFYTNSDHLSDGGAGEVRGLFEEAIAEAKSRSSSTR